MRIELLTPLRITLDAQLFGGADDIGEQHGLQVPIVGLFRPLRTSELQDGRARTSVGARMAASAPRTSVVDLVELSQYRGIAGGTGPRILRRPQIPVRRLPLADRLRRRIHTEIHTYRQKFGNPGLLSEFALNGAPIRCRDGSEFLVQGARLNSEFVTWRWQAYR